MPRRWTMTVFVSLDVWLIRSACRVLVRKSARAPENQHRGASTPFTGSRGEARRGSELDDVLAGRCRVLSRYSARLVTT